MPVLTDKEINQQALFIVQHLNGITIREANLIIDAAKIIVNQTNVIDTCSSLFIDLSKEVQES